MNLTLNYLHKQGEFLQNCDQVPYSSYIGGFGSGKTHVLILQALREASKRSLGLIGAPTYRLLADTTQRKFFELCPSKWIASFHKSENRVMLINGSEILFRSLDSPERLTNLELDWWALDEIGEVELDTFRMLQGRLRKLGGSHHGFCVGNPAGRTHWTYDYFVTKAAEQPDAYRLVQATSFENTFLDPSYARGMAASFGADSLYYKRFVLGQFVSFEGAYWAHFDLRPYPEGQVVGDDNLLDALGGMGGVRFGKAIDFGYDHPFVTMFYVANSEKIIFFDEYWQRYQTISYHCQQIRQRIARHQSLLGPHDNITTYTDHEAVSRAEIANAKDEAGTPIGFSCIPAEKKVMEGILLVSTLIEQRRLFVHSRCEHALKEIPSYRAKPSEYAQTAGRAGSKEAPVKTFDDTCDCIRMACAMEMAHFSPFKRVHNAVYTTAEESSDALIRTPALPAKDPDMARALEM